MALDYWKMKVPTIIKARELLYSGEIVSDTIGKNFLWLRVGNDHIVKLGFKDKILEMSCDCEYMGKKGIAKNTICSHIIAAILYINGKKGICK